ncbi:MAG TPA: COX15/CtaA family protein [Chthoniobacterales bacterium]|nr:COX15/CtaA family protein [Chthoniobacterales bacterium]
MAHLASPKRLLHWYAIFVAASVLVLICSGGLVTSHGAGMAVPDWPNSFGYNMFLFPVSHWVGGVLLEHTHRLIASAVGLLTIGLCALTARLEDRKWVKWLGAIALLAVIVQGVLGGLRVTEHNQLLGVFHGCLAQLYFCLVSTIALVTSPFWGTIEPGQSRFRSLRFWAVAVTAMVFVQLALGALMRHAHTGLSIPDFPTAYGRIFPPLDDASVARINDYRAMNEAAPPITAGLILLQYVHRIWAVFIVVGIGFVGIGILRERALGFQARFAGGLWIFLVVTQFCLGAWTIWSNKAADVATAHVFFGALTLMTGILLSVILSAAVMSSTRRQAVAASQKEVAKA